jgi:hypothetical protein
MSVFWIFFCRYTEMGKFIDISGIVVLILALILDAVLIGSFLNHWKGTFNA